ncbi:MAG: OPT/YSL family transporter, partial [Myxococcales bacterium]|nr:OPT/YSL family transporter [Myxococcales bacterium]
MSGATTTSNYRELTPAAVILGIVQGAVMTAAFVYIGLKLGFGLPGSSVAAIMGFALLRGVGRGVFGSKDSGSIVENNINQTIASGINTASAGVVFTFPALLLLGVDFSPWAIIVSAIAGSFMGIVIIIPLRKQLIEIERLRFPTGIAVASILKSPGAGAGKALVMGGGFAFAVLMTLTTHGGLLPET